MKLPCNEFLEPYGVWLSDRADGVAGHFAITRYVPDRNNVYVEHWVDYRNKWGGFGTCYQSKTDAFIAALLVCDSM